MLYSSFVLRRLTLLQLLRPFHFVTILSEDTSRVPDSTLYAATFRSIEYEYNETMMQHSFFNNNRIVCARFASATFEIPFYWYATFIELVFTIWY
jgi:hypothetical protein